MRFVCDNDVDAEVAARLRKLGHEAWTVERAGLGAAADDEVTTYAQSRHAVLLTHDVEFSQRRRRNVIGQHVWLDCLEWDAAELLVAHLADIEPILKRYPDLWIRLSKGAGVTLSWDWK